MILRLAPFVLLCFIVMLCSGCYILNEGAKYKFNDGIYYTGELSKHKVYVDKVDDDTIAVYPVIEFKDSTAIITSKRTVYASVQKKLKDNKMSHTFYKPSLDFDVTTLPLKYRPSTEGFPNQLTANFNGALYLGYRTDAYKVDYKRNPLNIYKQSIKHIGYSAGFYAGFGSSLINSWTVDKSNFNIEYEGVTLISGIAGNIAVQNYTFGISLGFDHLLDKNHAYWIYQGKPYIGFTLGLNLN